MLFQERKRDIAELKVVEMESKVKELEDMLHGLRERSGRLVDMERRRCLEYVPSKGSLLLDQVLQKK